MRVAVFCFDFPYPPNRGGRADVWRRVLALRALGHQVLLISWFDQGDEPTLDALNAVRSVVSEVLAFCIYKTPRTLLRRLLLLTRYPSFVSSRLLPNVQRIQVDAAMLTFKPSLVLCDGPYPAAEARRAAQLYGLPLIYRSHNIEHIYMKRQARAARRISNWFTWHLACIGLKRFETDCIRNANWVFDISSDDMAYWQAQGVQHISWLPPMAESALAVGGVQAASATPEHDVLFLGNLTTPNNVRGVEWLVNEIRPLVLQQRPETRFVVAGSRPGPHVRDLCTAPGVVLMADVPDALALYRSARVLVNPVRTGSGTHVKAVEMLMMRAPIVTASQGTMGLPDDVKRLFKVADTAADFAAAILAALASPTDAWEERAAARRLFGVGGLADALDQLRTHLPLAGAATDYRRTP